MTRQPETLREVDRAFIHTVMFQLGILPMEKTNLDMRRALAQLPPEEARVFKRKFRKLWRQAMRAEHNSNPNANSNRAASVNLRYGVGKHVPSRTERNARKQLVFDRLWTNVIAPMVKDFDNPDKKKEA